MCLLICCAIAALSTHVVGKAPRVGGVLTLGCCAMRWQQHCLLTDASYVLSSLLRQFVCQTKMLSFIAVKERGNSDGVAVMLMS